MFKRFLSVLLVLALTLSITPTTLFANVTDGSVSFYDDVPEDYWAYNVITRWSGDGYGVLKGSDDDGDGIYSFMPTKGLTLGELAAIFAQTFGYIERTEATVTPDWADEFVEKAISAGVIANADTIDASVNVTREQAIKYIALAYKVEPLDGETAFADNNDIDAEYKPYVNAFQKLGYVIEDNKEPSKSKFNPKANYTRAEAMAVIDNITSEITDKSIEGQNYSKNLIVRKSGVTVKDTVIKNDLIIGQGVGDGAVTLDNITLEGRLLVLGGSVAITVTGNTVQSTVVNKPYGEAVHLNGTFGTVIVKEGTKVVITGTVEKLIALGDSEVTFTDATANNVFANGANVKLVVNSGSTVENVTVNASKTVISGDGKVNNVNVTALAKEGVEVLTVPTVVTVDANAGEVKTKNGTIQPGNTATTSNPVIEYPETEYPSSSGGSSNSGSSNSGGSSSSTTEKYTLTIKAGNGGKITVGTSGKYKKGETIDIAAEADSGYVFSKWISSGGGSFANPSSASTKFTMPSKAVTITAVFVEEEPEGPGAYTKGEWVQALATKLGISPSIIEDEHDYFYGDTEESEYGAIIETVHYLGLLPEPDSEGYEDPEQDIPLFNPDHIATREFVAYTVAHGMGFYGTYELDCEDASDVKYKSEVAVVVQQGFMSLKGNKFNPTDGLTERDKKQIFAVIDEFNDSLIVDESEMTESITFKEGVIKITDNDYSVEITDDEEPTYIVTIAKTEETSAIEVGSIFVLPSTSEYLGGFALKAVSITESDNILTIVCSEPDMEEVISDFYFAGYAKVDVNNLIVADGVTVKYDPNGEIVPDDDSELAPFDIDFSKSLPGKLKFSIFDKEIGKTGIKVSGNYELSIPNITVKAKGKILGKPELEEITVSLTKKLKVSGSASYSFGIPETGFDVETGRTTFGRGKYEFAEVPIALGATGLTLNIVFFLNLEVGGKVSISYTITETNGFQLKNGAFRIIKDYTTEFTAVELNASAKFGVGVAARIALFSVWDLAGIDGHLGIGISGKYVPRLNVEPKLHCLDANIYLYATLELDKDTLAGWAIQKIFSATWSWDIFDESTSPLKKKIHIENLKRVPDDKCTYGKGSLLGLVKDAETNAPIKNARVELYNGITGTLVKTMYTASYRTAEILEGEFLVKDLPAGTYKMKVMATGYKAYEQNVNVVKSQRTVCEASLLIMRDSIAGDGTVSGTITNALTGGQVTGVSYKVRSGWDNVAGTALKSGTITGSSYSLTLAPGNYTIEFSKEGFVSVHKNIVIQSDRNTTANIAISPVSGIELDGNSFRVVLTWGETPRDLDSHLYGRNSSGNVVIHTWYNSKTHYDVSGNRIADLDLDDTTSYGPETSTVYTVDKTFTYSFYVHDYTNRDNGTSMAMSNSGAQVRVYSGETLIATFNILQNREGTCWHVFDYDAATGQLSFVNTITHQNLANTMPEMTSASTLRRSSVLTNFTDIEELKKEDSEDASIEQDIDEQLSEGEESLVDEISNDEAVTSEEENDEQVYEDVETSVEENLIDDLSAPEYNEVEEGIFEDVNELTESITDLVA